MKFLKMQKADGRCVRINVDEIKSYEAYKNDSAQRSELRIQMKDGKYWHIPFRGVYVGERPEDADYLARYLDEIIDEYMASRDWVIDFTPGGTEREIQRYRAMGEHKA